MAALSNGRKRFIPLILTTAGALFVTAFFTFLDARQRQATEVVEGERIARQVLAQVEGLYYAAHAKGEARAVEQAVRAFAQGQEPRPFLVKTLDYRTLSSETTETAEHDPATGTWEIKKLLDSEQRKGVTIVFQKAPLGFLGAHGKFDRDLRTGLFFTVIFLILYLSLATWTDRRELDGAAEMREKLSRWSDEARGTLQALGGVIRETLANANALEQSFDEPGRWVRGFSKKVHDRLNSAHALHQRALDAEKTAAFAQLQIVKLMRALPPEQRVLAEGAEQALDALRQSQNGVQAALREFERELEPLVMDADLTQQALARTQQHATRLRQTMRDTTKLLMGQVQSVKNLDSMK